MTTANARWVAYAVGVVALWIFIPELRRLMDWAVGGGISSVLPLVPLAAMVPAVFALRSWATGIAGVAVVAMIAALTYAGVVGLVSGNGAGPVLYTFADFLLPMLFGGWLAQRASFDPAGFARFTRIVLFMAAGSAAYGIIAYATLPPWEAQWLSAGTSTLSTGIAEAFHFRVYATMNSPGIFATFVALVLLLNLPNVLQRRAPDLVAASVCAAALALSLVRSAWVAVIVGLVVYFVLSPARAKFAGAVAIVALALVIPATVLVAVSGDSDAVTSFTSRVGSFGDIGNDDSANDRTNQIAGAFQMALDAPFGSGLGTFGAVTQLSTVNGEVDYIDSGYLARFVELGVFGSLAMGLALVLALACGVACAVSARRETFGDAALLCSFFAIQAGMVWLMFSGDLMRASNGLVFWIASFMLIGAVDRAGAVARARHAPLAVQATN